MQVESTGVRIKKAIKDSGIKSTHIASKLGIAPPQLAQIFKNTTGRSKYLSRLAEILNVSEKWLETGTLNARIYIAQLLDEQDIISLCEDSPDCLLLDELTQAVFDSVPIYSEDSHYKFAFRVQENLTDHIFSNDIMIVDTFIPLDAIQKKQVLIIYSKAQKKLAIGTAHPHESMHKLIVTTKTGAYLFNRGDLVLGVCEQVIIPSLSSRGKAQEKTDNE